MDAAGPVGTGWHFERARQMYETPMAQAAAASVWSQLALARLMAGDLDEADEALRRAADTPPATSKLAEPEILLCRAGVAMGRGDPSTAVPLYTEAAALVERTGLALYRPRALLGLAIAAGADGDGDRVHRLLSEADQEAADRRQLLDALTIRRVGADLLAAAGLTGQADRFRELAGDTVAEIAARLKDHDQRRDFLRSNAIVG